MTVASSMQQEQRDRTPPGALPPLRTGDRLTRAEFERRYAAMPNVKQAELIEGIVYMPSPVSDDHAAPHFDLIGWLSMYRMATEGVAGGDNGTVRLDLDNEPQPDAFLRILPEYGGQARVDGDRYVSGAPELVAEVAASSVSLDLHAKLNVYRRNAVREYLVWRVEERAIDWFVWREGRFDRLRSGEDGISRSEVLPGLWLDAGALVSGNLERVARVARDGLGSAEHAAFVARLHEVKRSHS
ncbi:MAG: Uma2 family endonuclease [Planctomycetota bacterium]